MKDCIVGDTLEFRPHPVFKNEWIASWGGYTVATASVCQNGKVMVTECHPDEKDFREIEVPNLDAAWRHIKSYVLGDFENKLKEIQGNGIKR